MLRRESTKFGDAVESTLNEEERWQYGHRLLCEVAQYMADDETDIIDEISLAWLVELALPREVPPDILGLLKNRAGVFAFLANDVLPSYRRFAHSQLLNYFLSVAVLDALAKKEVPKFVRRNIFSADFLAVFIDVLQDVAVQDTGRARAFFEGAMECVHSYQSVDRGARNLGAWLVAALPTVADFAAPQAIGPLEVDETIIRGTAPSVVVRRVTVNQLDARAADLRELTFDNCRINTAIVDDGTWVCSSFPLPQHLQQNGVDVWDPVSIRDWLDAHGRSTGSGAGTTDHDGQHGHVAQLVRRACRSPSFWIPESAGSKVHGFVQDPRWPEALRLLKAHGFIREEQRGVSGRSSRFVHIKQADRILANHPDNEQVAKLYQALARAAR